MILDIKKFIQTEQPNWDKLNRYCISIEQDPDHRFTTNEIQDVYILYRKAVSALACIQQAFAPESYVQLLEQLVARAYVIIYAGSRKRFRFKPFSWFFSTFPVVFRKHIHAFALSCIVTLAGSLFGAYLLSADPGLKSELLPFGHGNLNPVERVKKEETSNVKDISSHSGSFSAFLIQNNISVTVKSIALGITFGIGTLFMLFYNGIMLGGICLDYIAAGKGVFLFGWILPHGSIEIPSILIAGQAGFMIASAMIGKGADSFRQRFRAIGSDIIVLSGGVAMLLVWAGIVEGFFSQYHEPFLPYWIKISFGSFELLALIAFLAYGGKNGISKKKQ